MSKQLTTWIKRMYYKTCMTGNELHCPICKRSFSKFLSYGVVPRPNAQCPGCKSLERHRLVWLFINQRNLLNAKNKLLHVSPETVFYDLFSKNPLIDYYPVDKFDPGYTYPRDTQNVDITKTDFPDNSFDAIICNHVLEHIPEDLTAMQELKRVLKHGGWAIIMVPVNNTLNKTYEDFSITSPEERLKAFGQSDHVRLYGLDFIDRLRTAGFSVQRQNVFDTVHKQEKSRMALIPGDDIYFCT